MALYTLGWIDIAIDQYIALRPEQQHLVDGRIAQLLQDPAGPGTNYDKRTDQWTATDNAGLGPVTYIFRTGRPGS